MEKLTDTTKALMDERFGHDSIISVATTETGIPHVRNVDAYYEDGSFYVITYALSNKMRQIGKNSAVAVCGEWFTGHGEGINLGYVGKPEHKDITATRKKAGASGSDGGHPTVGDENTCILQIRLTDGVLFSHGTRYDIDFTM